MKFLSTNLVAAVAFAASAHTVLASDSHGDVHITTEIGQRCIESNGLPDHSTGEFPNRGNPNAIAPQSVNVCVPLEHGRPSGPRGAHDGAYHENFEFVSGSGTLDECNGGALDGQYTYFVTDAYPFIPRGTFGEVSPDFGGSRHQ